MSLLPFGSPPPSTVISDAVYGVGWDGVTTIAPSKNAVYDKIQSLAGGHDAVTLDANANILLSLSTQQLGLDNQNANLVFVGPASAPAAAPTFRSLVAADLPTITVAKGGTNLTTIAAGSVLAANALDTLSAVTSTSGTKYLQNNAGTISWVTLAAGGDVVKVGTPVDNQIGVWTGDGTIEGDTALTFDTTTDTLTIAASGKVNFGAVNVLSDSAGTTTLANIDALDATSEATIEAAIDTLANLTSIQAQTVTFSGALTVESASLINQDLTSDASPTFVGLTLSGAIATPTSITLSNAGNTISAKNSTNSNSVQIAIFEGDRSAAADNDLAYLTFRLSDSGGTQKEFSRISWKAVDADVGTGEDGEFIFSVMDNGSLTTKMAVGTTYVYPITSDGLALGDSTHMWSDLFLASGSVINFAASNVTITHSTNKLTFNGGTIDLGINNLLTIGSIGDTTTRVTKGWFVDVESTNMPTVGGTSLSSTFAAIADAYSNEKVDDRVAALIQNGTGISWSYNDVANTLTPTVSITQYTDELAQDAIGGILDDGTVGDINFTYDDATPKISGVVKNDAISYAKIQNVSATDKLLGRSSAGAGDIEEIACTAYARSILDDANEATFKATVNLEIGVDVQAYNATLAAVAGGTYSGDDSITTVGTITTGTWQATDVGPEHGGTGVSNGASNTITFTGNYTLGLTLTAATTVTLPTTGTLATLAGTEELDNKTLDTAVGKGTWTASGTWTLPTITLGGDVQLGEVSILLDAAISADGKWSGIAEAGTAGTTLAFGDLVYLAAADSRWELADASAASTSGDVKIGICILAAAADGNATTILLWGKVNAATAFPAMTVSAPQYISETAGDITGTQPTTTDAVIRRVGFANTADELFFCPSNDYITHT